jgi:hypothetical protein
MRVRAGLLIAIVVLAAAGCGGGDNESSDGAGTGASSGITEPTTTESEAPPLQEDRAYLLAFDFCTSAPLEAVSLIQGGSPEEMARDFASEIRPELREAALQGCLAALEDR